MRELSLIPVSAFWLCSFWLLWSTLWSYLRNKHFLYWVPGGCFFFFFNVDKSFQAPPKLYCSGRHQDIETLYGGALAAPQLLLSPATPDPDQNSCWSQSSSWRAVAHLSLVLLWQRANSCFFVLFAILALWHCYWRTPPPVEGDLH